MSAPSSFHPEPWYRPNRNNKQNNQNTQSDEKIALLASFFGYSDSELIGVSCFRQLGQYQGAGVLTGFGLLLRHLAQRKRLPLTAVFGRTFFPLLGKFFAIGTSSGILSEWRYRKIAWPLNKMK
jgi:hypothetical protein